MQWTAKFIRFLQDRSGSISLFLVWLLFATIFITGLLAFDDYGIPYDDVIERKTTLINLKYIFSIVAPNYPIPSELIDKPDLTTWSDRYYGVAIQLPTAILEWIFDFNFTSIEIYHIRHLWTFLQYFIGLIFFFRLLKLRFNSERAALIGVLLIWLSPRIFANSFYNIKDLPLLSWILVSVYFLFQWFNLGSRLHLLMFGLTASVVTNIRVIGGLLIIVWFVVLIMRWLSKEVSNNHFLIDFFFLLAVYGFFWILITPLAWYDPVNVMIGTVQKFSNYPHLSNELYFMVQTPNSQLPWHYLPVWIGITSPILVLLGFIGGVTISVRLYLKRSTHFCRYCDLTALILVLIPIGLAIGLKSTIYNGWRHFYFVYPWIVYFAVMFLEYLLDLYNRQLRSIAWVALFFSLFFSASWIIRFHPYQMVYFNALIPSRARVGFVKDYWCVSCRDALQPMFDSDPNFRIGLAGHGIGLYPSMYGLPNLKRDRVHLIEMNDDISDVDYVLVGFTNVIENEFDFPSFELIDELTVDGLMLEALFRRITNRLIPGEKISVQARTVAENAAVPQLTDWARETLWEFDETAQGEKAALRIEFSDLVSIDGITLRTVIQRNGLPDEVRISWSSDGEIYVPVKLTDSSYSEFFFEPVEARFLRIEGTEAGTSWKLSEVLVWDARAAEPIRSHEQGISFTD